MSGLAFVAPQAQEPQRWLTALRAAWPGPLVSWPTLEPAQEVHYAVAWAPPPGVLASLPNLKCVFSLGAGVDHLAGPELVPSGVPLVRLVDPALVEAMTEFVLYRVLRVHRRMADYERQQQERRWAVWPQPRPSELSVGIMGLGVLGADAAMKLAGLGFNVAAWSRSSKSVPEVRSFAGADGFVPFLRRSQLLVCLLPLTAATEGIINRECLHQLPRGAYLVNAARGGHVVESDLLAALDSEHLSGAALDVFASEPLPESHPFWRHPKIELTPHVASPTNPESAARTIVANIRRFEAGAAVSGLVDRDAGY